MHCSFSDTINEWEFFDLEKDPDEMESLMVMNGMEVRPGYENIVKDMVEKLKNLREKYKDNTGAPVKFCRGIAIINSKR
ncbi:MAG: hypothetical protein ACTHM5_06090 [Ginsengibacter sp.]